MGKIVALREEIYKKIAAGEVVERPLSVVKELVENALDAGATFVRTELEAGGKTLVRVVDNGSGFEPDEVEIAFQRHSTSKFREFSDFDTLATLGFRGEALPSILEVADIEVKTSTEESGEGVICRFSGGRMTGIDPIACNRGSSITVKNLFSNFPVRKKFLKSDRSEMNQITGFLEQVVLAHFTVTFELNHNAKTVFIYEGVRTLRERCYQVFGKEFTENLADVDHRYENCGVTGMISKLNTGVSSKNRQYFFVNGRNVREKTLYAALNNTFRKYLEKSRHPAAIIHIDVPPGEVDVNIHPMKLEIKFEDASKVYQLIRRAIENSIEGVPSEYGDLSVRPVFSGNREAFPEQTRPDLPEYFQPDLLNGDDSAADDFTVIGQYRDSYIIVEKDGDLLIVDQHNADERANFDQLTRAFSEGKVVSVTPLFPLLIELSPLEMEMLNEEMMGALGKTGFEIEHMGGNSYEVKKYPQILNERSVSETVRGIIGKKEADPGILDNVLAMIACKSSIKVNYRLNHDQMRRVVRELFNSSNPWFCPHKRPIIVNFSLDAIERSLKRK